jgi:hypothetical protein
VGLPRPPGLRTSSPERTGRGDLLVEFAAVGTLPAVWSGWLDTAARDGWQVVARYEGAAPEWRSAELRLPGEEERRAWFAAFDWSRFAGGDPPVHGMAGLALPPAERPAVRLPGRCRPIPAAAFAIDVRATAHGAPENPAGGSSVTRWAFATERWFDLDGDGALDAAVPEADAGSCPEDVRWSLWVSRGDCGHLVGTVRGSIVREQLVRAAPGEHGLPDVHTASERRRGGRDNAVSAERTYVFDGRAYVETRVDERRGTMTCSPHPCPTITCSREGSGVPT